WAINWCPFSNSTLNIALDNASTIVPSCSMDVCLAILKFRILFYVFVRGQYLCPVLDNSHSMFVMCCRLTVGCSDGPAISLLNHISGSKVDHRLDCNDHSFIQKRTATFLS